MELKKLRKLKKLKTIPFGRANTREYSSPILLSFNFPASIASDNFFNFFNSPKTKQL